MKSLYFLTLLIFAGCSSSQRLFVANSTAQSIGINVTPQTFSDTTLYLVSYHSTDTIRTTAFGQANDVDRAELRTIIVRDSSRKIIEVYRMSASYLILHSWFLQHPYSVSIDSSYRRLSRTITVTEAYHLAQSLYNTGRYRECMQLCTAGAVTDALQSKFTSEDARSRREYDEGYARYQGYLLMLYLSSKKIHDDYSASIAWSKIEKEIPQLARNLEANDPEFAR